MLLCKSANLGQMSFMVGQVKFYVNLPEGQVHQNPNVKPCSLKEIQRRKNIELSTGEPYYTWPAVKNTVNG